MLLAVWGVGAPVPAATAQDDGDSERTELMILLDGSGSIDAGQWELQKQGFAAAVSNESTFPLDGSVAVGVLQWSWVSSAQRTRLEIPLTELDSGSTRAAFVDELLALDQIGQLTNPGDGIRDGTDHLLEAGDPDSERYLCLSTDGVTNSGENLSSAVSYAQGEGMDRLSVIALGDPPFFDESTAQQHYGPHVFGGGSVSFAETVPEFRRLIEGACMNPALEVVGMEITQGVQDWEGSVPLVAGGETVLRAFVQHPEGEEGLTTTAFLHAERDGQPLPGSPQSDRTRSGITVPEDAAEARGDYTGSLNWILPEAWTHGDVTLEVRLAGGQSCQEAIAPAETCSADVSFQDVDRLDIKFMKVRWRQATDDGFEAVAPSDEDIAEQMDRVTQAVPHGDRRFDTGTLWLLVQEPDTAELRSRLLDRLAERRIYEGCFTFLGCERIYYGVVEGAYGGVGRLNGHVSMGSLATSADPGFTGRIRNRAAHELFHNFGIHHTAHIDRGTDPNDPNRKRGWCDETARLSAPDFPHGEQIAGVGERPALGPLGDADTEVWGVALDWFDRGRSGLGIVDPTETFALMSYCDPLPNVESQGRWASKPNWERAIGWLGGSASSTTVATGEGDHLLFGGVVDLEAGSLDLNPIMPLPGGQPVPEPEPGPYTLELRDGDGALVDEVAFDAGELEAEGDHPAMAIFHVAVPDPGGELDSITIRRDGTELATRQRGPSQPSVTITRPTPGAQVAGELVASWDVDADGAEEITSTLLIGSDEEGWEAVSVRTDETEVAIDASELQPSEQARARVLVSDGFSTATATSEPFTIEPHDPTVRITRPFDGQLYTATQLVSFRATAHAGGRELDGDAIEWVSDLDGSLGHGSWHSVRADQLSEGEHTITAVATGSGEASATDEVTIEVWRIEPPTDRSALDQVAALVDLVESFGLARGHERALLATLDTTRGHLEGERDAQACRPLGAFAAQVDGFEGNQLTEQQAADLRAGAEALAATLDCGG